MQRFESVRTLFCSLLLGMVLVISACGGGGGGGGHETLASARLGAPEVTVQLDVNERGQAPRTATVSLLIDRFGNQGYFYGYSHTSNALTSVSVADRTADFGLDFQLQFQFFSPDRPAGRYTDTLTIALCAKEDCSQPDRQFTVPITFTVGYFAVVEAGLPLLPVERGAMLPHDMVAAAYSPALDALVVAAGAPSPALHVHDLSTGRSRSLALTSRPTSLALEPGGLRAVVGHDAALSLVSLLSPDSGESMSLRRYEVPTQIGSLIFAPGDQVFAFNAAESWEPMRRLDLVTGSITEVIDAVGFGGLYGRVNAALHPNGKRLYVAPTQLSPSDLFISDLTGPTPTPLRASRHRGQYPICGNAWFPVSGARLISACGVTLLSSDDPEMDLVYSGTLPLYRGELQPFDSEIVSLSKAPGLATFTTLESLRYGCSPQAMTRGPCFSRLSLYDENSLERLGTYALPVVTTNTGAFKQDARFVIHRSNGKVVMVNELASAPDPLASVWLSHLP